MMQTPKPNLKTSLGPLELRNPIMTASGTFGYGREYEELVDLNRLGAIVVKGLSLKPRAGNPPPRIVETPSGMLNAIGLANIGVEAFLKEKLPYLEKLDTKVIVNIYGHHLDEYGQLAKILNKVEAIAALEVNISCPNVEQGGMAFGVDPVSAAQVTETVRQNTDKPVMVKLSPNVTDIRVIAKAVEAAGAQIISLINTLTGMAIDINNGKPKLANVSGGLSGPAIRPVAVFMVYQVVRSVAIPVIGMGGIMNYRDALEFLIAGAKAVQIGTASFVNPQAAITILEDLERFCLEKGLTGLDQLIGTIKTG